MRAEQPRIADVPSVDIRQHVDEDELGDDPPIDLALEISMLTLFEAFVES